MSRNYAPAAFLVCLLIQAGAYAQDCSKFLLLQDNKTVEMTIYDKKGDPNGRQVYQVSGVSTSGGATTGHLATELFDKKNRSIAKSSSTVQCNGGVFRLDMKMMLPQQQQAGQPTTTDVNTEGSYLDYPYTLHVGDTLKDGNVTMNMSRGSMQQTMTMTIADRKVEAQEPVTTPAGTWSCYRISYKAHGGMKMGPINVPVNYEGLEWYAPGFGIIKTQNSHGGTAITSIK